MLYGILVTFYTFVCILLVLIILVQKGKGSMGLGGLGGGTQMLFGGSGGQDIFQKITSLATIFVFGSLTLALMKSTQRGTSRYIRPITQQPIMPVPATQPVPPAESTK